MNELIEIAERNEIKVSQKSKKSYFTIKTKSGETLISFNTSLFNECVPDSAVMLFVDRNSKMDTPPFDNPKDEEQTQKPKPTTATSVAQASNEISPQEKGMFYKELGEWLRSGKLDMSKPINKALNIKYWAQMLIALDVKIEKKEDS